MKLQIDFNSPIGTIKPMHAVGQPPINATDFSLCSYLQKANIPYSRLHDVGGPYGGSRYVDIHNVFPNFDADENDPASYDFEFTDYLIGELAKYGIAPIYRLGETIENTVKKGFRARHIHPPKDFSKWARVCEHIIRHYNEGWADGFFYGIVYWEIWNEPEHGPLINGERPLSPLWTGTPEQFYEFYCVAAKHLKKCFGDTVKIGGYSASNLSGCLADPVRYGVNGNIPKSHEEEWYCRERPAFLLAFFLDFLTWVKRENAPLDFFSWHSYDTVEVMEEVARFVARTLCERGFENAEIHLNEWNTARLNDQRGTSYASATAAAAMIALQNTDIDVLNYYDARIGVSRYAGIFNPLTRGVLSTYYSFFAFGKLYRLGTQVPVKGCDAGVRGIAATGDGGSAVLLANTSGEDREIETDLGEGFKVFLIDAENAMTETTLSAAGFCLKNNQVAFLTRD